VNPTTGAISPGQAFADRFNALAVTPGGQFVYVADDFTGTVYGGSVDSVNGALTPIASYSAPGGPRSVKGIAVEATGQFLYASSSDTNFSGLLGAKIDPNTGLLTLLPGFPMSVVGCCGQIISDSAGKYLYALGSNSFGAGVVFAWAIDPVTGALTPTGQFAVGTPRQLAADPLGRYLYAATSGGLYGFYNDGTLTQVPGSPFYPNALNGVSGVTFDGTGSFLYASDGDVWGFQVPTNGSLTQVPGSPFLCDCTNIVGDSSGGRLYAAATRAVEAFTIDHATGSLSFVNGLWPSAGAIALIPRSGSANATLQSLEITDAGGKLAAGLKHQFLLRGAYSDGTHRFLTASATWTSSNPSVAAVANESARHGIATAATPGSATITATFGGLTATIDLSVE
jgi:6-phosphogluconolactonase (cycloisomerase 2 family)